MVRSLDPMQRLIRELQDLQSRVKALETAPRAQNTSVDAGAFKILSDEGFQIGAEGSGSGTGRVYGILFIDGELRIIGSADLTGTLTVNEDGSITLGGITITSDNIDVAGDGTITVGDNMILDPSANGGSVRFADGAEVYASGAELDLYSGSLGAFVNLNGTLAKISGPGTRWLEITSSGFQLVGLPTIAQSSVSGSFVGAVVSDLSGNLRRVVAD